MSQIKIRDVSKADMPQLRAIVRDTWDWADLFETKEALEAAIAMYVNHAMHNSSFGKVALLNGELAGVIFGTAFGEAPACRGLLEDGMPHALTLLNATEFERKAIYEYLSKTYAVYSELIGSNAERYGGTLDFIVVPEAARGFSVGKQLWHALEAYFHKKAVRLIYVYSDTDCNYGFYDHMGFHKKAELKVDYIFDDDEDNFTMGQFLYEYNLRRSLPCQRSQSYLRQQL